MARLRRTGPAAMTTLTPLALYGTVTAGAAALALHAAQDRPVPPRQGVVATPPTPVPVLVDSAQAQSDSALAGVVPPVSPTPTRIQQAPVPLTGTVDNARIRMRDNLRFVNTNAVELHKKFAISVACTVFVLVGAPIALRFPRGGVGLVIGVSLVIFGIYYIGLIAGEALADRNVLTPFWAMWAANIFLTIVGLFLLARMGRETATTRGGDFREMLEIALRPLRRERVPRVPVSASTEVR